MSITSQDETSRSGPHRRVERILSKMQISYESEYSFPPYSVDIYLQEWHLGVEIDGPGHSPKKDEFRDGVLSEKYYLPVLRLKDTLSIDEIKKKTEEFIILWAKTGVERRHQYLTSLS